MTDNAASGASQIAVTLKLNKQQLALLDRTVARGVAQDRVSLVRLALREYAAAHGSADTQVVQT